ncbi:NUDIX hydrolase [Clostridium luticellarii]|nr:NUDIX domain-containing protein [Clostridium luticellarii]MCI1944000.1 NUDIX domain-containing protein [Clostridium luticellarii]MCI1967358.1 NUDIX domain-containing protein [Clostridium luticellarii]MCI1995549.1 NUDIX domain-containing protein [Clostridium luticellarii]MCI2039156.1 NUDIX domain-containing protein [Clostridium luticellarii]
MELWDIYDGSGHKTGLIKKRTDILSRGEYHLAAEVWIINDKLEVLIQKRSKNKEILPSIWTLTTGCMVSGENTVDGSVREIKEELGICIEKDDLNFVRRIFQNNIIWDIYFVYMNIELSKIVLQREEVSDVKFVSVEEFKNMLLAGEIFKYDEIYDILSLIG